MHFTFGSPLLLVLLSLYNLANASTNNTSSEGRVINDALKSNLSQVEQLGEIRWYRKPNARTLRPLSVYMNIIRWQYHFGLRPWKDTHPPISYADPTYRDVKISIQGLLPERGQNYQNGEALSMLTHGIRDMYDQRKYEEGYVVGTHEGRLCINVSILFNEDVPHQPSTSKREIGGADLSEYTGLGDGAAAADNSTTNDRIGTESLDDDANRFQMKYYGRSIPPLKYLITIANALSLRHPDDKSAKADTAHFIPYYTVHLIARQYNNARPFLTWADMLLGFKYLATSAVERKIFQGTEMIMNETLSNKQIGFFNISLSDLAAVPEPLNITEIDSS